jgi:hypothetical protein
MYVYQNLNQPRRQPDSRPCGFIKSKSNLLGQSGRRERRRKTAVDPTEIDPDTRNEFRILERASARPS